MKKLDISMHQQIAAGALIGASYANDVWRFEFENQLSIEALGGWRVFEPVRDYRQRTLLGSRDVVENDDGASQLLDTLSGLELVFLHFNQMSEWLDLIFMDSGLERTVHMQLYTTSAQHENWRIIGEDFTDTDRLGIIEGSIPKEQGDA